MGLDINVNYVCGVCSGFVMGIVWLLYIGCIM